MMEKIHKNEAVCLHFVNEMKKLLKIQFAFTKTKIISMIKCS